MSFGTMGFSPAKAASLYYPSRVYPGPSMEPVMATASDGEDSVKNEESDSSAEARVRRSAYANMRLVSRVLSTDDHFHLSCLFDVKGTCKRFLTSLRGGDVIL